MLVYQMIKPSKTTHFDGTGGSSTPPAAAFSLPGEAERRDAGAAAPSPAPRARQRAAGERGVGGRSSTC